MILYKQILEHCKAHQIKNVIFISEDNKENWVDKKTKTIRKEIQGEAFEVAGIQHFIMMNKDSFLEYSKVERSQQVKEDFERADNVYNESTELEVNLSVIGKNIIDTLYNTELSHDGKCIILKKLARNNWDIMDNIHFYSFF